MLIIKSKANNAPEERMALNLIANSFWFAKAKYVSKILEFSMWLFDNNWSKFNFLLSTIFLLFKVNHQCISFSLMPSKQIKLVAKLLKVLLSLKTTQKLSNLNKGDTDIFSILLVKILSTLLATFALTI